MMSEVFMPVGRVELRPEEADAFGATIVTPDVETRTTVDGVGVFPMPEAGTSVTPVVREVRPLRLLYPSS